MRNLDLPFCLAFSLTRMSLDSGHVDLSNLHHTCSKHNYLPIKSVLPVLKGGVCQQLSCDWADFLSVMCKRFSGVLGFE